MNKWLKAYLPFLLLPTTLIFFASTLHKFQFHSDDCEYWLEVIYWRVSFAKEGVFWALTHWPGARTSFHSLLGVPLLWLGGGVAAGSLWSGVIFSLLLTGSVYRIFRAKEIPPNRSVLGAVTVGTFPYLICFGKVFLPELPFISFSALALASIFAGRVLGFGAALTVMLLLRPFESALFLAGMVFWIFLAEQRERAVPFAKAALVALALAASAFSSRSSLYQQWFHDALFPPGHPVSAARIGAENFQFIAQSTYVMLGAPGLLLAAVAFFCLWKKEPAPFAGWSTAGISLLLVAALGIMSTVDRPGARNTFVRYALLFVVTTLVALLLPVLKHARRGWAVVVAGSLLAYHLAIDLDGIFGPGKFRFLGASTPAALAQSVFDYHYYPDGNDELGKHLGELLPTEPKHFVLFAGRDPYFAIFPRRTSLFLLDKWPLGGVMLETHFPASYAERLVPLAIQEGPIALSKLGVSALVFVRNELMPGTRVSAYPNEPLVAALEAGKSERLGLKLARGFRWSRLGREQEVEIYLPASR